MDKEGRGEGRIIFADMKECELRIAKSEVYTEVAKTTAYIGAKLADADAKQLDAEAYDRVMTVDEDGVMLERFFTQAEDIATTSLSEWCDVQAHTCPPNRDSDLTDAYEVDLHMTDNFDDRLVPSIETALYSFFVEYVVYQWLMIAQPEMAPAHQEAAVKHLRDVSEKVHRRLRPERPAPPLGMGRG